MRAPDVNTGRRFIKKYTGVKEAGYGRLRFVFNNANQDLRYNENSQRRLKFKPHASFFSASVFKRPLRAKFIDMADTSKHYFSKWCTWNESQAFLEVQRPITLYKIAKNKYWMVELWSGPWATEPGLLYPAKSLTVNSEFIFDFFVFRNNGSWDTVYERFTASVKVKENKSGLACIKSMVNDPQHPNSLMVHISPTIALTGTIANPAWINVYLDTMYVKTDGTTQAGWDHNAGITTIKDNELLACTSFTVTGGVNGTKAAKAWGSP
jgi:hypothetical protein